MYSTAKATPARSSTALASSSATGVRSHRSVQSYSTTSKPSSKGPGLDMEWMGAGMCIKILFVSFLPDLRWTEDSRWQSSRFGQLRLKESLHRMCSTENPKNPCNFRDVGWYLSQTLLVQRSITCILLLSCGGSLVLSPCISQHIQCRYRRASSQTDHCTTRCERVATTSSAAQTPCLQSHIHVRPRRPTCILLHCSCTFLPTIHPPKIGYWNSYAGNIRFSGMRLKY